MKVIDDLWFTNCRGTVGIVIAEDELTSERKAYIGIGQGQSVKADTDFIIAWGNKLPVDSLIRVITHLQKK